MIDIKTVKQQLDIIGDSKVLNNAIDRALKVAPYDLSVLVIGESGSGKEFFPQIIHKNSKRKTKNYIAINCGSIPEGTIDSELFGHIKGAFTGADKERKGWFEVANGGTIFLDEVAEMPLDTQARLLRVLQNGEYIKLGSDVVQKTDVRVVAATNKDLKKAVKEGKFREDLYYRLSTIQIDVPSLRERKEDIHLIANAFAMEFAMNNGAHPVTFNEDAYKELERYSWPGNVRQLSSFIKNICLFEAGKNLTGEIIKEYLPKDSVTEHGLVKVEQDSNSNNTALNDVLLNMLKMMTQEIDSLKHKIANMESSNVPQHNIINQNHDYATAVNTYKHAAAVEPDVMPVAEESEEGRTQIYNAMSDNAMAPKYREVSHYSHAVKKSPYAEYVDDDDISSAKNDVLEEKDYELIGGTEEYKTLEEIEKEAIVTALNRNHGKRKITAQQLNISERTLYRKIEEYKLS